MVDLSTEALQTKLAILLTSILLLSMPSGMVSGQSPLIRECEILVDWDYQVNLLEEPDEEGQFFSVAYVHRYRVVFDPDFPPGSSPSGISIDASHIGLASEISPLNVSYISAGGEVDIELDSQPDFGDKILVNFSSSESTCTRSLFVTNWNQPIEDHEITRETVWSLVGADSENQNIDFEGRGWQKRQGSLLESNELGNGSLQMNTMNGLNGIILDLSLDRVWLNESYDGDELIAQDFEMVGNGSMVLKEGYSEGDYEEGFTAEISVSSATVNRSWQDDELSERITIEGSGWLSLDGGDNNSSGGGFGEIHTFLFESFDEDGQRRAQNFELEANASMRILGASDFFSFELDDLIIIERWSDDTREEQFFKATGGGEFGFEIEDDQFSIDVNGTIPLIHLESSGGETVSDTIIVDGTYDGDAEGSFGLVRQIVDSGIQENSEGVRYEVDKIQNEFWFNVSATPFGPISQEFGAEHNLTYEFTVPQEDWQNRTVRLQYVEDNGTVSDEFPPESPIIEQPSRPEASSLISNQISRESGKSPQIVVPGDMFVLLGNPSNTLEVTINSIIEKEMDGHIVEVAEWTGRFDFEETLASGFFVNEGPLSGLLYEVSRWVTIESDGENQSNDISFQEYQKVDRILYPSIITADENTPPSLESVRLREGLLHTEGGASHIEVLVNDADTDVVAVIADLSSIGLGLVDLSDSGLKGDLTIHDDVWTSQIIHEGLEFGDFYIPITITDYWVEIIETAEISVVNLPPRVTAVSFSQSSAIRGESIGISVDAIDGHGVSEVSVDLLGQGGDLFPLNFSEYSGTWSGVFSVPTSIAPGEREIPLRMSDSQGAEIITNGPESVPALRIDNEHPNLSSLEVWREGAPQSLISDQGKVVHPVMVSEEGGRITHHIEATISDYDGVSSVQAKIGRLAEIGKSEQWLLMVDDGTSGDRFAGDGIYSLEFTVRPTIPEGEIEIKIRATDIFLSSTPPEEQGHIFSVYTSECCSDDSSWFSKNLSSIVIVTSFSLLICGMVAIILQIRKSDFD
ncbi:MAG: choice-of-anchor X domain-containing protein [Candidatus Thalassarchaeaceae archaeon]